uniref:cupin domain-containing protein n=1 Tax=Rhodococcus qingshengii TaxID=334542 RepID=UPI001C4E2CAE|nr:cupin domain-containing protein [Rhodococcus qingshengii]
MSAPIPLGILNKVSLEGQPAWTPADFDLRLINGDPEIHLHLLNDGSAGEPMVGFARGQCSTFEVELDWYETVHIIGGRARIEVDDVTMELGPGDATTLFPGRVARWTIFEPITEFFVMSEVNHTSGEETEV